ncbi:dTDP-4-dehydrorhamnose reductase [Pseudomonas knackmussii]|uniref:dTDP-4-dehydrorhamnose reductase n=1 Tax=Pseudomonas knackmussii TaxID=65741 RepID=A0ABY4KUJ5_9PSED|nr:dTDP-4-dehydrorhamnose reductase [Pseudomonas knackmussii]UPQ84530.1 dTDP-4-dehydrorhamnose reductase [Pseudomonas knackmussii]
MDQIYAVVLSYKRKDLLKRCLDGINAQSRRCDGIIVVDNASNDGTEEMLLASGIPNLKVYILSHNTGASGGFSAGFRIAYQQGADFVWMMDDDVIPEPDALQKLVDADEALRAKAKPHSFLISMAYTEEGLLTNVPRIDERPNTIDYENWPALLDIGVIPVRPATFVSILVPRASLQRYGLPIASMFMWGDDTEFTLRISQDAPGYLVAASKVLHMRRVSGVIDILRETDPNRVALHRHLVRNELFVARRYFRKRRVLGLFISRLGLVVQMLHRRQFAKARIVMNGLLESVRFFPEPEAADAPVEALGVTVREAIPKTPSGTSPGPGAPCVDDRAAPTPAGAKPAGPDNISSQRSSLGRSNMRVLVCGAGGQVGHCLVNQAASFGLDAIGLLHKELDITSPDQIRQAIERYQPAVIINAAAYTNLDHAEAEVAHARAVNRDGAANLAQAANHFGIPLFHLSSEYVFAGDSSVPYRETDAALPICVYGETRRAGEVAISETLDRYLILRTSWIYGEHGNNFVKSMLNLGSKTDEVSVVSDQIGCPTRSRSVARVLIELALRYCRDGDLEWGLYHYSGSSPCSWAEFAVEIFKEAEQAGLIAQAPRVLPVTSDSLPRAAARPAWSVLDCNRMEQVFGIKPKPWREELRHVIRQMNDRPWAPVGPAHSRVPFRSYPQGEERGLGCFEVAQAASQQ